MNIKILHPVLVSAILISLINSYYSPPAYGAASASFVVNEADADRYIKFRNNLSSVLPTNNWNDALEHMSNYLSENKNLLTVKTSDDFVAIWQLRLLCIADRAALGTFLGMPDGTLGVRMAEFMNDFDKVIMKNMGDWAKNATPKQQDDAFHNFGYRTTKLLINSIDKFDSLRTASNIREKYKRAQSLFEALYLIDEYQKTFFGENAYRQQTMDGFADDGNIEEIQVSLANFNNATARLKNIQKLPVWKEVFSGS